MLETSRGRASLAHFARCSLERLSILSDGRVAYQLRKPRRNGATRLVLEPIAFLARIAALIPPPRFPLVRLSGVFAPNSPWRASVVPRGPVLMSSTAAAKARTIKTKKSLQAASSILVADGRAPSEQDRPSENTIPSGPRTERVWASQARPSEVSSTAEGRAQRTSLGAGVPTSVGARIDWASLVRRTYLDDVLSCPCGGRRFVVADITDRDVAAAILGHLGLPTQPPPIARARSPGFEAP